MSSIVGGLWVLGALACGAEDKVLRRDLEAMRAEMQTMQRENGELTRRVEALSARLDSLALRPAAASEKGKPAVASSPDQSVLIPPNLTVVKVEPPRKGARSEPHRPRRAPPPLPTAVPIREPDGETLAALAPPGDDLAKQAQADLDAAHALAGLGAARALEEFTAHYPRHPYADNALVEAAHLRPDAAEPDAACALYRRCVEEYPAGDALPEALEQLGECHARRGQIEQARRLLERVVDDYPGTSAAKRAAERLAEFTGGGASRAAPSRQGAVP